MVQEVGNHRGEDLLIAAMRVGYLVGYCAPMILSLMILNLPNEMPMWLRPEQRGVHGRGAHTGGACISSAHTGECVPIGDGDTWLWNYISANILARWSMVDATHAVGDDATTSIRHIYIYPCDRLWSCRAWGWGRWGYKGWWWQSKKTKGSRFSHFLSICVSP